MMCLYAGKREILCNIKTNAWSRMKILALNHLKTPKPLHIHPLSHHDTVKLTAMHDSVSLKSTSWPNFILQVMSFKIFVLEGASGTGKESSRENLPRTPGSKRSALYT